MNAKTFVLLLVGVALLAGCTAPQTPPAKEPPEQPPQEPPAQPPAMDDGDEVLGDVVEPPEELSDLDALEEDLTGLEDLEPLLDEDFLDGNEIAATDLG